MQSDLTSTTVQNQYQSIHFFNEKNKICKLLLGKYFVFSFLKEVLPLKHFR